MRWIVVVLGLAAASSAKGEEIDVAFAGDFDRGLFRPEGGGKLGRWEVDKAGLRGVLAKGSASRPPIKYRGTFRLDGDFEVVARYEVIDLPKPAPPPEGKPNAEGANLLEIALKGPEDRTA